MTDIQQFSVETFAWGADLPSVDELVQVAQTAEELGFYSVNVPMVNHHPVNHVLDVPVVLTAMLRGTSSIRICPDAFVLPLLPPYYWAKLVATLDVMSNGRIIAGFCAGSGPQFQAHGVSPRNRGRRSEEEMEVITRLWTEESVTHEGEFYQLTDMVAKPKPVQEPHPPIWVSGGVKSIARAARFAEYLTMFATSLEQMKSEYAPSLAEETSRQGTETKLASWVSAHITPDGVMTSDQLEERFTGAPGSRPGEAAAGIARTVRGGYSAP